jgi:orotate phosphoribosyltransferase
VSELSPLRARLQEIVRTKGVDHFDEPVQLASGEWSQDFIDAKRALADGTDLEVACRAMIEAATDAGVRWDAVGGLTMGADHFAHGVALLAGAHWFVVRKQPKGRGTNKLVEGWPLGPGDVVFLVDDVVTTGGSIQKAYHQVRDTGATVAFAATLVDRGEVAGRFFDRLGVPYTPLLTYRELDLAPVGDPDLGG